LKKDQEMKKFVLIAAVTAVAVLADGQPVSAKKGCGGGRGGCCTSCCYTSCGYGGCGYGGCGYGGCAYGGCGSGGCGGYAMGGVYLDGSALAQADANAATLVVSLPEDAKLTIDGEATTSTSAKRVFVSPALEQGKVYEYTLKAQVVRDGQTQVATAKVTVRPGQTSQVELTIPAAGVAAQ
jgi:uncharacterized protein (TIGR03000 family)